MNIMNEFISNVLDYRKYKKLVIYTLSRINTRLPYLFLSKRMN